MSYNPTEAVEKIRELAAETMAGEEPGADVVLGLARGVHELDDWLTEGNRLPAQWGRRRVGRVPLEEDGWVNPVLKPSQHGTRYGYNQRCRCIPCRAANRHEDPEVILELKRERGWA